VAKKAKLRYHSVPSPLVMANRPDQPLCACSQSTHPPHQQTLPTHQHHRSSGAPMVVHSASTSPDSHEARPDLRHIQYHHCPSHGAQLHYLPAIPHHQPHRHQFPSPDRLSVPSLSSTASSVSLSVPSSADSDDVKVILPPFNELVSGAGKVCTPSYHRTAERSPLTITGTEV